MDRMTQSCYGYTNDKGCTVRFAVLKFLESDDVYNRIICCYFIKKLQIVESKQYEWWKQNSNAVRKLIDGRHASVSNLIK